MGNGFAIGQADRERITGAVGKSAKSEMVPVKVEMGIDLIESSVESFEVGAVPADRQIPRYVCRLWNHQEKLVFFRMFLKERHDFFRTSAGTVKHDQQFDGSSRVQSFRNDQKGVAFAGQFQQDVQ